MDGVPYIEVVGLTKRYGDSVIVDDVSFSAREGEFLTFLGPSGCGKTTTLRCIGGFTHADAGDIRIAGSSVGGVPPHRRELGMVFQNYALFPHLSVFENVAFGLRIRNVGQTALGERVRRALQMVKLDGLAERFPRQLSGGQQQRVALARAIVYEPKVLLLDEPLSNLDAKLRVEMRTEIRDLQKRLGITAIYVTHDQEEALSVSDRIVVMNGGRIEQISSPWDLYNAPKSRFVASFVGTANLLPVGASAKGAGFVCVADIFDVPWPGAEDGSARTAVIRPENIVISPASGAGVEATIRSVSLVGASLRVELQIAERHQIVADVAHGGVQTALTPGAPVRVGFDPAKIVIVSDRTK